MIKKKRFVVILAVLLMFFVLLAGCSNDAEDANNGLNGEAGLSDNQELEDESVQIETQDQEDQDIATAIGTLKEVNIDNGTLTIATESDGELEIEVNGTSEIFVDESLVTFAQLADKIDSEVSVEYNRETKEVTAIRIQE